MPRKRRNKVLTSLESLFDAGGRQLNRTVRSVVGEATASLATEMKELRKALTRLQRTLAQGAGMAVGGQRNKPLKLCLVPGCGRKHAAKGLCKNHYQQWLNRKKKEGPNAPKPGGVPRHVKGRAKRRGRPRR
jgi:hypothetical protein